MMRFRVAFIILLTAAAYVAAALVWRQVFPFRDGIAQFLPAETIAYVHANLTPAIRRDLLRLIPPPHTPPPGGKGGNSFFSPPPDGRGSERGWAIADALTAVLQSQDVNEIAVAWLQPERNAPIVAVIVGQRASSRPDVVPTTTVAIGPTEVRMMVVRTRSDRPPASAVASALASQRRQPVQVFMRPRLLPIPALAAATHLLPDVMVASGTIGRDGFVLRSDGRSAWALRVPRPMVVVAPRDVALQVIGVPVRAIVQQLDFTLHRDLARALAPVLPESVDVLVDLHTPGAAFRLPWDLASGVVAGDALRDLAARIWPSIHAGELIADPASIRVIPAGLGSWEVQRAGDMVAVASVADGSATIATRRDLLDEALAGQRSTMRLPRGCAISGHPRQTMMIASRIRPQVDVAMLLDGVGTSWALCGRIAAPMD